MIAELHRWDVVVKRYNDIPSSQRLYTLLLGRGNNEDILDVTDLCNNTTSGVTDPLWPLQKKKKECKNNPKNI